METGHNEPCSNPVNYNQVNIHTHTHTHTYTHTHTNKRRRYGRGVESKKNVRKESSLHATKSTQIKWDEFIQIYTEGIDRYVLKMAIREKKKNEWFN